ncbi:hypothetical protein BXO88_14375 [Oribacterium sp. C9]|uniref:sugar phosphate isomerase/epimerase family protein n=1 Tax=Oribacterium sp. C9 TaxID=1943579 RepID=UPI00098EA8EB|nr:TIM barrel protein [Oribacterium sp. C9]MBP3242038.1 sugar phosphate isomerase/epimerase [Oribacterium sp.]OON85033.1 hypothetical protein BXO88_14375 [Oribacterium sp. C9]
MILPGIVSATFKNESPDFVLEQTGKAGLRGIEWSENWHVPLGDKNFSENLRSRTIERGIEIAAYGSYFRLATEKDPERRFQMSIDNAVALKAPVIRIWGGTKATKDLSQEEWTSLKDESSRISSQAKKYGIKVALEWHKNTVTDTNETALRFLNEVESDNLYCLWQPTMELSMEQRTAGLDLVESQRKLLNIHVYHWDERGRRPFSEGISEWKTYFSHVDTSLTRYGLLEFVMGDTKEQFFDDAKEYLNLLKEING